jgi:hypothetical protein
MAMPNIAGTAQTPATPARMGKADSAPAARVWTGFARARVFKFGMMIHP